MNNKNVTIDLEWFLDLVKRSKEYGVHDVTLSQVTNERDEPKEKLNMGLSTGGDVSSQNTIAELQAECDRLRKEWDNEMENVRKCCEENERLKDDYERAENALRCISDIIMPIEKYQESNFKSLCNIIREYNKELAER